MIAQNVVSSASSSINLKVFYKINGFSLHTEPDVPLPGTAFNVTIELTSAAQIPMYDVYYETEYFYFENGSFYVYANASVPAIYREFYNYYSKPGNYTLGVYMRNALGYIRLSSVATVWEPLDTLMFDYIEGYGIYKTNYDIKFSFNSTPTFGFKYSIDYKDGIIDENLSQDLIYYYYTSRDFSHTYTTAGKYDITCTVENGLYKRTILLQVSIRNAVPDNGYTLHPYNHKYPWTYVQTNAVEISLLVNETIPPPTEALCVLDPDDGSPNVENITFDSRNFSWYHDYRQERWYYPTLNCSNNISDYVYEFALHIEKFNATMLSVSYEQPVPFNDSETCTVYFHLDNGGFVKIPLQVDLFWQITYQLDGIEVQTFEIPYDNETVALDFDLREDYEVEIKVNAAATNTSSLLIYPVRVGVMRFEYTSNISFINKTVLRYTMYGVNGDTTYAISFDDGEPDETCRSVGMTPCNIDHICPSYGYKLVRVVASNGTYWETAWVNITCDSPMDNVTTDIPTQIKIPNGVVNLYLRLPSPDIAIPVVHCEWIMGDPINRELIKLTQEISPTSPFYVRFQYIAIGLYEISIHCWNLINETSYTHGVIVTNDNFLFTGVFDRTYSQKNSPMLLSSMIDTEIFCRPYVTANRTLKTHFILWTFPNMSIGEENPNRLGIVITRGLLPETTVYVEAKVSFVEEPTNFLYEPTYIKLVMPPPQAVIVGGDQRLVKRGLVTADAFSESYDPVYPDQNNLLFSWSCLR